VIDSLPNFSQCDKAIFEKENCIQNCRLIETEKAHYWCEDIVWNGIKEMLSS